MDKVRVKLNGKDTEITKDFFESIFCTSEIAMKAERNRERYAFFCEGSLVEAWVSHADDDIEFIIHDTWHERAEQNLPYIQKQIMMFFEHNATEFTYDFKGNALRKNSFYLRLYWK
jgi:hypothetical protein